MNVIKRSAIEWINLFTRLNSIKEKYGFSIFKETIILLSYLEQQKMVAVGVKGQILDLLVEHEIDDLSLMKIFLERLNFNLENAIEKVKAAQIKYGLDNIAFVLDEPEKEKEISVSYSNFGYQKAYFPKDIIPVPIMDFKMGEIRLAVNPYAEFIVDKKEEQTLERTFYTNSFRFGSVTLPLKAEMDYYDWGKEKRKWMDSIVFNLAYLGNSNTTLLVKDPNQVYNLKSSCAYEYNTILTDGILLDSNERILTNRNGYFNQVFVKGADVLMICQMSHGEITNIKLIIHPEYFKKYIEELKKEQEKGLLSSVLALLDDNKRKNMNGLSR